MKVNTSDVSIIAEKHLTGGINEKHKEIPY